MGSLLGRQRQNGRTNMRAFCCKAPAGRTPSNRYCAAAGLTDARYAVSGRQCQFPALYNGQVVTDCVPIGGNLYCQASCGGACYLCLPVMHAETLIQLLLDGQGLHFLTRLLLCLLFFLTVSNSASFMYTACDLGTCCLVTTAGQR